MDDYRPLEAPKDDWYMNGVGFSSSILIFLIFLLPPSPHTTTTTTHHSYMAYVLTFMLGSIRREPYFV